MKTRSQVSKDIRITRSMNHRTTITTEAGSQTSKRKLGRKRNGHQRSLNDFPDAILCHILSFLPTTKEAVRTSVLSKMWRYLWTSLPNLDFRDRSYLPYRKDIIEMETEHNKFIDFVENVLCRHNAPPIKKIALFCNVTTKDDVSCVNRWISTAVSRNAVEFDISVRRLYNLFVIRNALELDGSVTFPHCLFTSETLEVLKILTQYGFQLPPQICLPNLKKLTLCCQFFKDIRGLNLLLASSSTLEELEIDNMMRYNTQSGQLIIPAPKLVPNLKVLTLRQIVLRDYHALNLLFASSALEKLALDGCKWEGEAHVGHLTISARNLQSLTIHDYATSRDGLASVTISSPLRFFYYGGRLIKDYRLSCSSSESLERATLLFYYSAIDYDIDRGICIHHCHNILRSLGSVKYLKLSSFVTMELYRASLPIFNDLTNLELDDDWQGSFYGGLEILIKKCPRLETLKLPGCILAKCDTNRLSDRNLECLSSLKNITIESFKGNAEELVLVQILLAKATSLETMEIGLSKRMNASERKKIKTCMSNMPRGSKSCRLKFRLSHSWT